MQNPDGTLVSSGRLAGVHGSMAQCTAQHGKVYSTVDSTARVMGGYRWIGLQVGCGGMQVGYGYTLQVYRTASVRTIYVLGRTMKL